MKCLILACLFLLTTHIGSVHGAVAQQCVPEACSLPECRCAGTDIPGGLAASATPQMITISFDDALRVIDHEMFFKRILANRTNPNGCESRFTFFVSHDNTDYALLQTLAADGHEMASHSITHRTELGSWWHGGSVDDMASEIVGMQDMMRVWGGVTRESIKGWRTPFLATSENQIKVLHAHNFTYECSMQTPVRYWPFTLDYKSPLCESPATCPIEAYPGLWVIPNIRLLQANGFTCGMLDSCTHPQNQQQVYDLLVSNFDRHYNSNRAPFGIYLHAAWFFDTGKKRLEGLIQFLDYAATFQDVYIVTHTQLLEWVRSPTPLSEISDFEPWKCPSLPPPSCSYQTAVGCVYPGPPWMQFKSCAVTSTTQCPTVIPGFGDILGTNGSEPNNVDDTTELPPCNPEECQLPNCHCAGTSIPGGLATSDTPQMITFGFIGSMQETGYDTYLSPVLAGRTNPNGCSAPATFFVSNPYTNYALVESLAAQGHEIADYSVTARRPRAWWAEASIENLTQEIVDMRDIIRAWSNVPESNIRGFRSPLRASSENAIRVLHDNGFQYEASMETSSMYWPFTLDYKSPICTSPATCPDNSYPGLWIVPNIVHEQDGTVFACGELDICLHTVSKAEWLQFFKDNFHRHYDGNRAPFSLYASVAWFYFPARVEALQEFLDYVANLTDTYFVTHSQMLDWVRNPTPLSQIEDFEPWQCPSLPPPRCDYQGDATLCRYTTERGTEYLNLCDACPAFRPDLGNPLGEDPDLSRPSTSAADPLPPTVSTSSASAALMTSFEVLSPSPTSNGLSASMTSESVNFPSSSSEAVPSSSSETVPSSSSEAVPSSSETVSSSSSETVPSSSSEAVPSSSSEAVSTSSSETVLSSSSEDIQSSSETVRPSSSGSIPPSSPEGGTSSEASSSTVIAAFSSSSIALTMSVRLSPSTSPSLPVSTSATVTPSRSATNTEGSVAGPQTDNTVGLAVGLGVAALTVAAVGIAATALVRIHPLHVWH